MKDLISLLNGKKTYFTIFIAVILLAGQWAHKWVVPQEIYGLLLAMVAAFLRHGMTTEAEGNGGGAADRQAGIAPGAIASVLLVGSLCVGITACMTSKVVSVTPGGTNAQGGVFSPVTNTVTIVDTNNLALDCLGIQGLVAGATVGARMAATNAIPALQDAQTALGGLLDGANAGSVQQILEALGKSDDASLASAFAPIVTTASTIEQALLAKYGTTVAGQISIAITRAVYNGISLGLAGLAK